MFSHEEIRVHGCIPHALLTVDKKDCEWIRSTSEKSRLPGWLVQMYTHLSSEAADFGLCGQKAMEPNLLN